MRTLRQEIAYLREEGFHRNTIERETLLAWLGEQVAIETDLEAARAMVAQLQQQVKPLTDEQIAEIVLRVVYEGDDSVPYRAEWTETTGVPFLRAIERAHGITGEHA